MSAQLKFILPPMEQQQEATLDWKPPLCFPGASLLLFPVQYYEFFIKPTAISCLFQTVKKDDDVKSRQLYTSFSLPCTWVERTFLAQQSL